MAFSIFKHCFPGLFKHPKNSPDWPTLDVSCEDNELSNKNRQPKSRAASLANKNAPRDRFLKSGKVQPTSCATTGKLNSPCLQAGFVDPQPNSHSSAQSCGSSCVDYGAAAVLAAEHAITTASAREAIIQAAHDYCAAYNTHVMQYLSKQQSTNSGELGTTWCWCSNIRGTTGTLTPAGRHMITATAPSCSSSSVSQPTDRVCDSQPSPPPTCWLESGSHNAASGAIEEALRTELNCSCGFWGTGARGKRSFVGGYLMKVKRAKQSELAFALDEAIITSCLSGCRRVMQAEEVHIHPLPKPWYRKRPLFIVLIAFPCENRLTLRQHFMRNVLFQHRSTASRCRHLLHIILGMAEALEELHSRGVVHSYIGCDSFLIDPQNLSVTMTLSVISQAAPEQNNGSMDSKQRCKNSYKSCTRVESGLYQGSNSCTKYFDLSNFAPSFKQDIMQFGYLASCLLIACLPTLSDVTAVLRNPVVLTSCQEALRSGYHFGLPAECEALMHWMERFATQHNPSEVATAQEVVSQVKLALQHATSNSTDYSMYNYHSHTLVHSALLPPLMPMMFSFC